MPWKVEDLFSTPNGGTMAPEASPMDMAASLNGKYVYIHSEEHDMFMGRRFPRSLRGVNSMYVLDTVQSTFKRYDLDDLLRRNRTHIFTFVLSENNVAMLLTVEIRGLEYVAVFFVTLDEERKKAIPGKLIGQAIRYQSSHLIACQWGTELFVMTSYRNSLHIHRLWTERSCMAKQKLMGIPGLMQDAVAYDDKLFFLKRKSERWLEPKFLLIVEFEKDYEWSAVETRADPVDLYPKGDKFGMDHWNGCMWILTEEQAGNQVVNNFWKLELNSLSWTKLNLQLPHSIEDPLVHTIPMGRAYFLGGCPDFPISWLPLAFDDLRAGNTPHCTTPAHLYTLWLDVPKLGRLAAECLRKNFPRVNWKDPTVRKGLGVPEKVISSF